ncbi:MAG: hypothetical protein K0S70_136 [Microbacterium sp.]|jgi:hypothetical protein|nr:hypothetical protein [Microbacterium sp.]
MNTNIHPLLGAHVLYTLDDNDVRQIVNNRRQAGQAAQRGNDPRAGDVLPAVIVKVFGSPSLEAMLDQVVPELTEPVEASLREAWKAQERDRHVNLQVHLDGNDTLWVTSRTEFNPEQHGRRNDADQDVTGVGRWIPDPRGHWEHRTGGRARVMLDQNDIMLLSAAQAVEAGDRILRGDL